MWVISHKKKMFWKKRYGKYTKNANNKISMAILKTKMGNYMWKRDFIMIKGNLTVVKFQTPNYMDSKQLHTHTKKTTTQY